MIPEKAHDWLKEDFGLDSRDYHVISDELGAADTHRVSLIENSPETIVDSFVVNGQKINLHEIHGVPVVEAPGIWSYVPNEAGLRKLELHQMKQVMGDDLPDSLIEDTSQYFREEGNRPSGFFPEGWERRSVQGYIEEVHGIPMEKYTDFPLAE